MHPIEPPVATALVLVCDKCGKRFAGGEGKQPSRRLASQLKKACKAAFGKRSVRVLLTSCMDICPDQRVSVAIAAVGGPQPMTRFFTVKVDDIEATSRKLMKELNQPPRGSVS